MVLKEQRIKGMEGERVALVGSWETYGSNLSAHERTAYIDD
jgi:hypothetical protein